MKKNYFNVKDKILFLKDYDHNNLSIGWLHHIEYDRQEFPFWVVVTKIEDLGKDNNDVQDQYQRREAFIIKYNPTKVKKFNKLSLFLQTPFISKYCYVDGEKALFITKRNNRVKVLLKVILSFIKVPIYYFIVVILFGTTKLLFGDIFTYYSNEHKMFKLKANIKKAKFEDQVNSVFDEKKQSRVAKIYDEMNNLKQNNSEINRVLIATLIALISLYFSLK